VAREVIRIQEALTGTRFDVGRLLDAMLAAFAGIQAPVLRGIADRNS
jgi:hypothetical protein